MSWDFQKEGTADLKGIHEREGVGRKPDGRF